MGKAEEASLKSDLQRGCGDHERRTEKYPKMLGGVATQLLSRIHFEQSERGEISTQSLNAS